MNTPLSIITKWVDGAWTGESSVLESRCTGASKDTRTIKPGDLYIPIIGEVYDGHQFVEEALRKGAIASFWQEDHLPIPAHLPLIVVKDSLSALQSLARQYREIQNVKVIGVTGSNGKTTTKDLIASVLSAKYRVHKTEGNLNSQVGLPFVILHMEKDTEILVLEMGMSNRGEIERLSHTAKPDVAIITNIGESHLQQLGSRENIAEAKLEITAGLSEKGLLIYNGDEPLLERNYPYRSLTFGKRKTSDLCLEQLKWTGRNGLEFTIHGSPTRFQIPLLGEHNVLNAIAAVAVGRECGLTDEDIAIGLRDAKVTGMRIEVIKGIKGMKILNDAYNASPTSMKAALQLLNELPGHETKIAVLGDMLELGDEEKKYHQEVGEQLDPSAIDWLCTYGSRGKWIAEGASRRFPQERILSSLDKQEIIDFVSNLADANTVTLIKASRGMKLESVAQGLSAT